MFGFAASVAAQVASGGNFTLSQTAIASGGDVRSGGVFSVADTVGQNSAGGFLQNSPFAAYSGFWTPPVPVGPTAAEVTISGRITAPDGRGINNVRLLLVLPNGTAFSTLSNSFGYYRFENIEAGQTCVLTLFGKRQTFANSPLVLIVNDNLSDINFVADQQD